MRNLNYQLKQLCRRNRDGSRSTQVGRERILTLVANDLHQLGFRGLQAKSLKPKHVEALTKHWLTSSVSAGTIKNRMSAVRWWAEKIDKRNVVARENAYYGIPERKTGRRSPVPKLDDSALRRIPNPMVRMSLRLQAAFGLRREEAIKIRPAMADHGDCLWLKSTWTKGGRSRTVPIVSPDQRVVLDEAKSMAGLGSLIPSDGNYVRQLRRYEHQTAQSGFSKLHGLRHAYAHGRYRELTGWLCPAAGGCRSAELSPSKKSRDQAARLIISQELGHSRIAVTRIYLD